MRVLCNKYTVLIPVWVLTLLLLRSESLRGQDYADAHATGDTLYAVTNALKFDPVQIVFGDFQVYFEKMIGSRFSVEVGAGPTRRNFAASWWDDELDALGRNVGVRTRYAATLAGRLYLRESGELHGPYVAMMAAHRRHDKVIEVIDENGVLVPGVQFTDVRRFTSLMLAGGFQALSMRSNVFADFYLAGGVRYKSLREVATADIHDPAAHRIDRLRTWVPVFQPGVRIGYGF